MDEIQKAKDLQNKLKIYYDIYPELKFFISGSASVSLQKKSKESLAGRIYDFILPQLSFDEFLDLKGMKVELEKVELYRDKILPHFFDYLRKGGFPEITHQEDDEKIKSYIKNNVIERIIYRDLPVEFGLKDIELLNILIKMVAESPGMVLNYDSLSRDLKRSKTTIINYISYLEYALILRLVYNYRKGFVSSSRKLRKIYLTNVSISFALVPHFYTEKFLEKVVENLVINKFNVKNYYRNNYEIDAVIKTSKGILPVEVKYGKIEAKKY
ncbi:MAG: ATP-binding protein [Candidatus Thermoplasmatota archaeon]|nr:ATP-binding protein [Candidatus Thermoplasmatota archaeon]